MKKLLLAIIILGVAVYSSRAQYFFNKRETLHSLNTALTSVVQYNHKYYTTGISLDSINYTGSGNLWYQIFGVRFAVFDENGNIVRDTMYQNDLRNIDCWTNSMQLLPNGNFLVMGESIDTFGIRRNIIIRFDTLGNMLGSREYEQPFCNPSNWYKIRDFKPTGTGEWLMLSLVSCPVTGYGKPVDFVLTKMDSSFNIIWEKKYGDPYLNDVPCKILVEQNGYLLAGGRDNSNSANINYSFKAELIKTDTSGNIKWTWLSDPSKLTGPIQDIVRTSDSGYVFCGTGNGWEYSNGVNGEVFFKGWVQKLDSSRNVIWSKSFNDKYDPTQFNKIIQQPNGNIQLFGTKNTNVIYDSINGDIHSRGWFVKLNANGDSLGERTYNKIVSCYDVNKFYDIKQTDDGGFIMVGESTDNCNQTQTAPIQRGWIIKVDSNGCLGNNDPQCWKVGINEIANNDSKTMVYPNPAQDILYVKTTLKSTKLVLTLYDLSGKSVIQAIITNRANVDINNLSSGMYIYRLTADNQPIQIGKIVKQ